jgi:hypothetical protein
MDAVEFLNQLYRRYKSEPEHYCETINLNNMEPISFVREVANWAKEHPAKTRQSEFLKQYPHAELSYGYVNINPCRIDSSLYDSAENQKTHILKKEDMYSLYPEKTQVRSYGSDELYPIGIMWFMASDPNQTDEVPGEWEMVSQLWKRIK